MFDALLNSIGGGLMSGISGGISSAVGGLFGGSNKKAKGPSAAQLMAMQEDAQYRLARNLPTHQVAGMRYAGLNPILAATQGVASGQQPTNNAADDRMVGLQEASVRSQIANQSAQANLYNAQAEKTQAETETELERPANVSADTSTKQAMTPKIIQDTRTSYAEMQRLGSTARLQDQLARTEEWKTKRAVADFFFRELELDLAKSNLGPRQAAEIRKISAEARSAETEAELNESIRELERKLGMVGQAAGIARGIFGRR